MDRLHDHVAIVTGAASGIGRAIALAFSREGAKVAAVDLPRQKTMLLDVERECGAKSFFADVSDSASCYAVVEKIVDALGTPSILVNNAGVANVGALEELSEEDWDQTFDVNVKSIFLMGRAALPHLRKSANASIINMASESAFIGFPMHPAYCASKAAVVHLTKCLAVRYADDGIRINSICPGTIDTPLYQAALAQMDDPDAVHAKVLEMHPLGLGTPEDIAMAAVYLASCDAKYVTGTAMSVDGGSTAL
jgi:NAD(P)-dependent dehydrogenase (short-subunit alcohol dehydrogenase family)